MTIRIDVLVRTLAQALDLVEIAYLGATSNHGRRIAVLCAAMGRHLGMSKDELSALVTCALLHDNALTEYFLLLKENAEGDVSRLGAHCEIGQRNVEILPFRENIQGYILYHHERADGQGPFRMSEGYCPLAAELIAAADMIDVATPLHLIPLSELETLRRGIEGDIHQRFTGKAGEALLAVLDGEMLASLRGDRIEAATTSAVPAWVMDSGDPALLPIAELIAHIIDYKSAFTKVHTRQIANRAWVMAEHYDYDPAQKIKLYLAAALHDLGKLAVPSEVLEKPGKLDQAEFEIIKTHITYTRELLSGAVGLGDIVEWAANHHEKLDGRGYPLGKGETDLDFNSRLMACIDIYQAVSEERPYHPRRSHAETMPILYDMADKGGIDLNIVKDMDVAMAPWSGKDVETPKPN
ncbi:MAG: HD domain-containing protein [Treponema sp.]|jgi:HD-GYP domain-containing protein (c-di-GMP phosphodiesterase class II)|nr:HD domain-containing protein [Treponema sp.]